MTDVPFLLSDLDRSTAKLVEALVNFPRADFNKKPKADSWSAGDAAEHLYKIERAVARLLAGEGVPTEHRPADKKEALMATAFPNRDRKFPSPDLFLPGPEPKDQDTIVRQSQSTRQQMARLLPQLDLRLTCSSFPHPVLGHLIKWEWVYFVIYHSARHLAQIEQIKQEVN